MEINISIPDSIFDAVQSFAKKWYISPDELCTIALTTYIAKHQKLATIKEFYAREVEAEKWESERLNELIVAQLYFQNNWAGSLERLLHDDIQQMVFRLRIALVNHFESCHKEGYDHEKQDLDELGNQLISKISHSISLIPTWNSRESRHHYPTWLGAVIEGATEVVVPDTIGFEANFEDKIMSISVPAMLSVVLLNLLLNARQSLELSGTVDPMIRINAIRVGDNLQMEIIDNGSGIEPEDINKIWIKNFTTKKHHTGLGLKISKFLVDELDGEISVESIPHQYTRFVVTIPIDFERQGL